MNTQIDTKLNFKYSGHETFALRFAWIPKAVKLIEKETEAFKDENQAMTDLGVGKNMVKSIKFWIESANIARNTNGIHELTDFGNQLFGYNGEGHDPYLEDIQTLWSLHWNLSTNNSNPIFFWHYLLNYWHRNEFSQSDVVAAFAHECDRIGKKKLSASTYTSGFRVFLNTYLPRKGKRGEISEENLDSPLVEIELLHLLGNQLNHISGKKEDIYRFRVSEKPEISNHLFLYSLWDFWTRFHHNEKTLSFREVAYGINSPGLVFKLPEQAIRDRLETIHEDSNGHIAFEEGATFEHLTLREHLNPANLLDKVYNGDIS